MDLSSRVHSRGEIPMDNRAKARQIVREILSDLTGRSGLQNEWDQIDCEIQTEIITGWRRIVEKNIADMHCAGIDDGSWLI